MEDDTQPQEIEQVDQVPETAQAMDLVQGPDGRFYLVPETEPVAAKAADTAPVESVETTGGLFSWADPILADPVGWAQANLLNMDVLLPYAWQLAAIIGALMLGVLLAPRVRHWVSLTLTRLPENLRTLVEDTAPRLVRPALWTVFLYIAQSAMAGVGMDSLLVRIASSLALAWLLIRIVTAFLPDGFRKPAGWVIFVFAAFYAIGILDEVMTWLGKIMMCYLFI